MKIIVCFALATLCLAVCWKGLLAAAITEEVSLSSGPYLPIAKGRSEGVYTISALPLHQKFFLARQKLSWYEANFYCSIGDLRLLQLDSASTAAELRGFLSFYGIQGKHYWTGGSRLNAQNSWDWNLKYYSRFSYTNWAEQEPTNSTGKDCVKLWGKSSKWYSEDCDMALDFICQR